MAVILVAAAAALVLLRSDGSSEGRDPTAREVAAALDCAITLDLDYFNAPIRGGSAVGGVACATAEGGELHIFDRAPIRDGQGAAQGGTLSNIDRNVGTSDDDPAGCLAVLVGPSWFVVANEDRVLDEAAEVLGGSERPIRRGGPPVSYPGPGGCGSM